jgi:hypothetical protein
MTHLTICTSISKANIISTGGEGGGQPAAGAAGVLEVEPDGQGAGQQHGQDRPAAGTAQDPGQRGSQLGDDERAVQEQRPQARKGARSTG